MLKGQSPDTSLYLILVTLFEIISLKATTSKVVHLNMLQVVHIKML